VGSAKNLSRILASLTVGALLLAVPYEAAACSCAPVDPWRAYAQSDAALIGVYAGKTSATLYRFRVEEDYKAELPAELDVVSSSDGASCGIEARVGQRLGLFLDRSADGWRSSLCSQARPDQIKAAAEGLPKPNGRGPVRMLIGGSWGDTKVQALDGRGRPLAYGRGSSTVRGLGVCPGSRQAVEVTARTVGFRDLRTMRPLRSARFAGRSWYGARAHCHRGRAYAALLGAGTKVVALQGRELRTLGGGRRPAAAFSGRYAYLAGTRRVFRLDLVTRRTRVLADFTAEQLAVNAAGTRLAVLSGNRVAIVEVPGGRVRQGPLLVEDSLLRLVWDGAHLVVLGRRSTVFDHRLRVVGSLPSWYATDAVGLGGRVAGVGFGELRAANLPRGPIRLLRDLLTSDANAIAAVDRGPNIRPAVSLPCARG
jgi:hypothetical protein